MANQEKQLSDCCKASMGTHYVPVGYDETIEPEQIYYCSKCRKPCSIYSGEPKENFLQVGRMIECGACHPEKFEEKIRTLLAKREQTARQEENKAWLEGRRCSTCGNEMKPDGINDTCENCWETN